MNNQDRKRPEPVEPTGARPSPPAWLTADDPPEVPSWAELPRLEVSDQVSGSMAYPFPSTLPLAPPPPEQPELIDPPPGMVVVNDDFAALHRLRHSRFAPRRLPADESVAAPRPSGWDLNYEELPQQAPVVYGMVLRNGTTDPVYEVRIEHDLPPGPRYLAADPPPRIEGRRLIWEVGTLEPGERHRFKVSVQPNRPGELPADATALFRVYQCLHSRTRMQRPKINLNFQVPETIGTGEQLKIRVETHNVGTGAAEDFRVLIALPEGLSHPDGPALKFQRPSLASNETFCFEGEALVERPGAYQLQAFIVGNGKVLANTTAAVIAEGEAIVSNEEPVPAPEPEAPAPEPEAVAPEPEVPAPELEAPAPEPEPVVDDQFLIFTVGDQRYALLARDVVEVRRPAEAGPGAIALRSRLNLPAAKPRRIIVTQAGYLLAVDATLGVRQVAPESWRTESPGPLARAATELDGRTVAALDLDALAGG